jgi:hypothetical protein
VKGSYGLSFSVTLMYFEYLNKHYIAEESLRSAMRLHLCSLCSAGVEGRGTEQRSKLRDRFANESSCEMHNNTWFELLFFGE